MTHVSFNRPYLSGREFEYIGRAIESMHLSGAGPFTWKCHARIRELTGARHALLTASCTDALEMCALLIDAEPRDEVIVPSYTFVSTANAFALRGLVPVFADIDPLTLNLDPESAENALTSRTRAAVAVHYAGAGCDMQRLSSIGDKAGITLIEDNAHGLCGTIDGQPLGSFAPLATLSFHETKNFTCGEGGALLINDEVYADRAEILWEKGTNRRQFLNGHVDKYTWVDLGSSFLPSDLQAAFLFAQLESAEVIQALRHQIWNRYHEGLAPWAAEHGVRQPFVPDHVHHAAHMYYMVMPAASDQLGLIEHCRRYDVDCVFHYQPLHVSPMGLKLGGRSGMCPVTEDLSARVVRLPFFNGMTETDQERVLDVVTRYRPAG